MSEFRLLMISAMYENGGNVTHRFFDGPPELFVYPFESQLGTAPVTAPLTSMFSLKNRWPGFDLAAPPQQDFHAIIDEECRVRLRTPHVSKFRHVQMDLSDDDRGALVEGAERSRNDEADGLGDTVAERPVADDQAPHVGADVADQVERREQVVDPFLRRQAAGNRAGALAAAHGWGLIEADDPERPRNGRAPYSGR